MNWCEKHDHFKRTCPWCEIEQMRAELNRQWISVKDRLPNIGDKVLVIEQDGDQLAATFDGSAFFDDHGMGAGIKHFTHWMPLPEPPEKGDGNE